jgi:hypothetical protein
MISKFIRVRVRVMVRADKERILGRGWMKVNRVRVRVKIRISDKGYLLLDGHRSNRNPDSKPKSKSLIQPPPKEITNDHP